MTTHNISFMPTDCKPEAAGKVPARYATRRTFLLSTMFALLLGTGVYLEYFAGRNWNSGEAVLLLHLVLGFGFTAMFLSWVIKHIHQGLARSQRSAFTWLSWLLLAEYAAAMVTGLLMTLPTVIYLGGGIWFWRFETTHLLAFLHLWSGYAATAGLLVHLALRHWREAAGGRAI
ncbi:hypothetical protein [Dongia sp.]|uniref:hypothetical protein n=1 Tax=Dongia sp. TaxID=1977262 RepID=UPI0035B1B28B